MVVPIWKNEMTLKLPWKSFSRSQSMSPLSNSRWMLQFLYETFFSISNFGIYRLVLFKFKFKYKKDYVINTLAEYQRGKNWTLASPKMFRCICSFEICQRCVINIYNIDIYIIELNVIEFYTILCWFLKKFKFYL